nr:MAG TPA: hypothetical protein [Caudoviricetes sp.]
MRTAPRIAAAASIIAAHIGTPITIAAVILIAAVTVIFQHDNFVDIFDSVSQLVNSFQVTGRHFTFLSDFVQFCAQHVFQVIQNSFTHGLLLSAHSLDHKVCVRKQNGLCACIFGGNGQAAAARNFNKRRHIDIKEVFYCCRCHGCSRTVQRFTVDSKRRRNSFHCAACRDSNVCTEAHFETRFALVRNAAQRNNTGAFSVYDTALARYCRFRQWHVLACCHAHGIGVCKFSHKIIPFKKIVAGRLPRHILHHRHGAEHVGCPDKLPYSVLAAAAVAAAAIPVLIRRRNLESRNRAGVVIGELPTHIGFQRFILRSLTCGKLCGKKLLVLLGNFGILGLNALRRQCVKHSAGVRVLVFDDIPSAVLNGLARVASLRSEVVVYALDSLAGLAAAICLLHLHGKELLHKCGLLVCAADFSRHKAVAHALLYAVDKLRLLIKAIAQAIVHVVNFALNVGKIRRKNVTVNHPGAVASTKAAIAAPVTAPAAENEQEKDNDPPRTVTAEAPAVAVTAVRGLNRHRHYSAIRR